MTDISAPQTEPTQPHDIAENATITPTKKKLKFHLFIYGVVAGAISVAGIGYYSFDQHISAPQENLKLDAKDLRTQLLSAQKIITTQSQNLAQMQSQMAQITQKLEQIEAANNSNQADLNLRLQGVEKNVGAPSAAMPAQSDANSGKSVLILALEVAANSGQPFQSQLARFRGGFPKLEIPPVLQDASNLGIISSDAVMNELHAQHAAIIKKMTAKTVAKPEENLPPISTELNWQDNILQKLGNWVKISKSSTPKSEAARVISQLEADISAKNWQNADKFFLNQSDDVKALLPKTKAALQANAALSNVLARAWIELEGQK